MSDLTVLAHFSQVRRVADGWMATCPAHADRNPSLHISHTEDRWLFHCFAGCAYDDIVSKAGLDPSDLSPGPPPSPVTPPAAYVYRDDEGREIHRVLRQIDARGHKTFKWQHRDHQQPDWSWGRGPRPPMLYRLDELANAPAGAIIFIPEGEKDADLLARSGLFATTSPGGAGKWKRATGRERLAGHPIVIMTDNDEPGRAHARDVAGDLIDHVPAIWEVSFPDLPAGGDVSDWVAAGGHLPDLVRAIGGGDAPRGVMIDKIENRFAQPPSLVMDGMGETIRPYAGVFRFRDGDEYANSVDPDVPWAAEPWLAIGAITKLDGAPKAAGKTTFACHMMRAVLDGDPFLGVAAIGAPVLFLSEQSGATLRLAFERAGLLGRKDFHISEFGDFGSLDWPTIVLGTFAAAEHYAAKAIVFDTLPACAHLYGDLENSSGAAREAIDLLQVSMARYPCAVLATFHDRKSGGEVGVSGRGSNAFAGAVDVVLQLTRGDGQQPSLRRLAALSRFPQTPSEVYIDFTDEGYAVIGDHRDAVAEGLRGDLPNVLPLDPAQAIPIDDLRVGHLVTQSGIVTALKALDVKRVTRGSVHRVLEHEIQAGRVGRIGDGVRNNPHRYWLRQA